MGACSITEAHSMGPTRFKKRKLRQSPAIWPGRRHCSAALGSSRWGRAEYRAIYGSPRPFGPIFDRWLPIGRGTALAALMITLKVLPIAFAISVIARRGRIGCFRAEQMDRVEPVPVHAVKLKQVTPRGGGNRAR